MNRSLAVIAISLLILSTGTGFPEDPVSRIRISDSTAFEVYAFYDSQGLADHYGARIYTPICEGSKCYAVEIDMIWDLTGASLVGRNAVNRAGQQLGPAFRSGGPAPAFRWGFLGCGGLDGNPRAPAIRRFAFEILSKGI